MIYKTKGIVIKSFPYLEASSIVKILTKEFGLKSYIIKGGRRKRTKTPSNIFQSLYLLELEVYNNPKKDLQFISEVRLENNLNNTFSNIKKTSLAFFLTEIISQCIKEGDYNERLYDFLEGKILLLESLEEKYSLFHLFFLLELSELLGFMPMNNYSQENCIFDMLKGRFVSNIPIHSNYLSEKDSYIFSIFLSSQSPLSGEDNFIALHKTERQNILNSLILFYELHLLNTNSIQSHHILSTIL